MRSLARHFPIALMFVLASTVTAEEAHRQATTASDPDLRCLSYERLECGCQLTIATLACPGAGRESSDVHLFSELNQGAPLWLNLAGRELSLRSRRPLDDTFRYGRGDSWREDYEGEGLKVRIDYRPGESTCPEERHDEGCEFFDVAADVVVTAIGRGSRTYRAKGACGC